MIDFNRPAFVGKELIYIQDAIEKGMLCGDGGVIQFQIGSMSQFQPGVEGLGWMCFGQEEALWGTPCPRSMSPTFPERQCNGK